MLRDSVDLLPLIFCSTRVVTGVRVSLMIVNEYRLTLVVAV
mgnify:CR=1 FL=1